MILYSLIIYFTYFPLGEKLSSEGYGKVSEYMKGRIFVYIPADVRKDSTFPFEVGERVKVKIDGKRLIIEQAK
jgi:hypothetical protein